MRGVAPTRAPTRAPRVHGPRANELGMYLLYIDRYIPGPR
jgi:hypothetical protein